METLTEEVRRKRQRWARRTAIIRQARGSRSAAFGRTAGCGFALGGDVEVCEMAGDHGPSRYVRGVATCGSVWSCPVCSAKIRTRRSLEVEHLAKWHRASGGELVLLTLTLRHQYGRDLSTMVGGLSDAFRRLQRSAVWSLVRPKLAGQVRSLEVTYGDNGWHPHLHVLLLADAGQLGAVLGLCDLLGSVWADAVVAELGDEYRPSAAVGCDARKIDAATYVTKIAAEAVRSDLKGRSVGVWQLLDAGYWSLVAEYATAMRGRRAVQWSRGLRASCGLGRELTDDELAAQLLDDGAATVVLVVPSTLWNKLHRAGLTCGVVEGLPLDFPTVTAALAST